VTRRLVYTVTKEPAGPVYASLLAEAERFSTWAVLVVRREDWLNEEARGVLTLLKPHLLAAQRTREWPGTKLSSDTAWVYIYDVCEAFVDRIKSVSDRLYQWRHPDRPEDLIFLRSDRTPWLVSIAHERDAYFELDESEVKDQVKEIEQLGICVRFESETTPIQWSWAATC
jgi:hypothetical protein